MTPHATATPRARAASASLRSSVARVAEERTALGHLAASHGGKTLDLGPSYAQAHGIPLFDAMIAAAGVLWGCGVLVSEDFQHAFVFAGGMRVGNPFLFTP